MFGGGVGEGKVFSHFFRLVRNSNFVWRCPGKEYWIRVPPADRRRYRDTWEIIFCKSL